jgi:nucleoside-diphosphate-sugar epimerase
MASAGSIDAHEDVAMRVLLTGAAGFIGRHVLEHLQAIDSIEIHATAREAPTADGAIWHQCDLLDRGAPEALIARVRPTHVLHLAWYAETGKFWNAPVNLEWVTATLALATAFARSGGKRFVGAGSCAEYDWSFGRCTEDMTPTVPASLYGQAKLSAGELAQAFLQTSGPGFAWGRVFFLYGPHEAPARLVAHVANAVLSGRVAETTSGEQRRDYLHVADCASAFVSLLLSSESGVFNISSGTAVPVREIVLRVAELAGDRDKVKLGAITPAQPEPPLVEGNNEKLRSLGWKPRFELDDGLTNTVQWWRDHLQ